MLRQRTDRPSVTTGREAQVSAQHSVAVALLYGKAGVAEFTDAVVHNPQVLALRGRVRVVEDAAIPVEASEVMLRMVDGTELTKKVAHARGSAQRQMTDAEIEAKFHSLAAHGCPTCDAGRLIDAVWAIDCTDDVGAIMTLATPR